MTLIRVVDFETSGTEPPEAQVCEVGICDIVINGLYIGNPQSWLCEVAAMPPEVRAIHHISLAECAGKPPFMPSEVDDRNVSVFAAHNWEFENKFFKTEKPVICTYKAALRVWPDAPSHSNGTLRYWLEDQGKIVIDNSLTQPAHRAGPDAYVTAHILKALLETGVTGKEMAAWTKEPRLLPRCPLGKMKGRAWPDVEAGFLGWMLKQESMEEDLKWNARREIERRSGVAA